jgi:hypothetical protein
LKYNRTYTLKVGTGPFTGPYTVSPETSGPNGFSFTPLVNNARITPDQGSFSLHSQLLNIELPISCQFSIRREFCSGTQTGTFKLYNLSEAHRNQLFKNYYDTSTWMPIDFRGGYENGPQGLMFRGNVLMARSYREGRTNVVTELTCQDLQFTSANSFSSFTAIPNSGSKQVSITEVAELLNSDLLGTTTAPIIGKSLDNIFTNYPSFCGPTLYELQKIVPPGTNVTIDNGQLKILSANEGFYVNSSSQYFQISSSTGLLDIPIASDSGYLECKMLFQPTLTIGQLVQLTSEDNSQFNGVYPVYGVYHEGIISPSVNGQCITTVLLYRFGQNVIPYPIAQTALPS